MSDCHAGLQKRLGVVPEGSAAVRHGSPRQVVSGLLKLCHMFVRKTRMAPLGQGFSWHHSGMKTPGWSIDSLPFHISTPSSTAR